MSALGHNLVRLGPPSKGDRIHRAECVYAKRAANALPWVWAEGRPLHRLDGWRAVAARLQALPPRPPTRDDLMSDPSTDLEPVPDTPAVLVVNHATGELVDLHDATDLDLVCIVDAIQHERGFIADDESLVLAELLRRLDKTGVWTRHVRATSREGVTRQWIVKAPSKVVGTTRVDADRLRDALATLLADDSIAPELACAALKRTVTITATVSTLTDLRLGDRCRGAGAAMTAMRRNERS